MLPEEAMEAGAVALEGVGLADEAEQPVGEAQTEAEVAADGTWLGKLAKRVTGAEPVAQPEAQQCGDGHFWTPRKSGKGASLAKGGFSFGTARSSIRKRRLLAAG